VAAVKLEELGLTPLQLAEVEGSGSELVDAWLAAVSARAGLRSPAGWFLSGVRSGNKPEMARDARQLESLRLVERYLESIAHVLPSEAELVDEVFGLRGRLRPWASDEALRARIVETWRRLRAPAPIPWP
jgi:hypothetical protein